MASGGQVTVIKVGHGNTETTGGSKGELYLLNRDPEELHPHQDFVVST